MRINIDRLDEWKIAWLFVPMLALINWGLLILLGVPPLGMTDAGPSTVYVVLGVAFGSMLLGWISAQNPLESFVIWLIVTVLMAVSIPAARTVKNQVRKAKAAEEAERRDSEKRDDPDQLRR